MLLLTVALTLNTLWRNLGAFLGSQSAKVMSIALRLLAVGAIVGNAAAVFAQAAPNAQTSNSCITGKCNQASAQHQVWLISTWNLPDCPSGAERPEIHLQQPCGCRKRSSAAAFYATDDPAKITCFYIPASRVEYEDGIERGLQVYRELACCSGAPMRFVIWTWPNAKSIRFVQDFRSAAQRADTEAYYLGRFIAGMRSDTRVSLIGFSLSARIVTGTLHVLGGGVSVERQLAPTGSRPRVRAVVWGAGVHDHWLLPGQRHGCAVKVLDRMAVMVNPCDPILKRYDWICPECEPVALGYTGLAEAPRDGKNLSNHEIRAKVVEYQVGSLVGKTHGFDNHVESCPIMQRTRQYALWR